MSPTLAAAASSALFTSVAATAGGAAIMVLVSSFGGFLGLAHFSAVLQTSHCAGESG